MQTITTEKFFNENILPILEGDRKTHGRQKISYYKVFCYLIQALKGSTSWRNIVIENQEVRWENLYYHFNKWVKNGAFERLFLASLEWVKADLDLSMLQIDGTHTPTKMGGEDAAYRTKKNSNYK